MAPYSLVFMSIGLLLIASHMSRSINYYYTSIVVLILFSGLRVDVGVDYQSYDEMFYLIRAGNEPFEYEFLNYVIIHAVDYLELSNKYIFLIYSIITLCGVSIFIEKFSPSKELSLLMFFSIGVFYLSTFNNVRQWAGIAIALLAIVKLSERKYIQAIFAILAAVLFHFSTIVWIILPLLRVRWKLKTLALVVFLLFYLSNDISEIIQSSKYSMYYGTEMFDQAWNIALIFFYVGFILFSIIYFGYFNQSEALQGDRVILLNMNLISMIILSMGAFLGVDFLSTMRANVLFQIQLVVLVPIVFISLKSAYLRSISLYSCILFCVSYYFYTLYFNGELYMLTPYQL